MEVRSGDEIEIGTWDANSHYYDPTSTDRDAAEKPPFLGHPLTGPIFVNGASAGRTLRVDILDVQPASWGYTAMYPGRGLLPDEFTEAHLRHWDLSSRDVAVGLNGVKIPLAPFLGVMGVVTSTDDSTGTIAPRRTGGNIDVRQLVAASSLLLPIEVEGGLLSVGDAHAAQGDGEVCVTAIETDAVSVVRLSVIQAPVVTGPHLVLARPPSVLPGAYHGCIASATDLMTACRDSIRRLVDWITSTYSLDPIDSYVLCSVVAELRVSQVVNAPNWTVTAMIPLSVFP